MKKRGWKPYRSPNPNPRGVRKCNSADFYRSMRLNRGLAIGNFDEEMLYLTEKWTKENNIH